MTHPVPSRGICCDILPKDSGRTAICLNPPARSGHGRFLHRRLPGNSTCYWYAAMIVGKKDIAISFHFLGWKLIEQINVKVKIGR